MTNRISRRLFSWQISWSSLSVWRKQWFWKAFYLAFSNSLSAKIMLELAGWQIGAWASIFTENVLFWAPDLSLIFQMVGRANWKHGLWMLVLTCPHHIQMSPISFFLMQLWGRLGVTTLKDTKICWKPFSASISTSCSHFLHRHKTEPRPERHRLHQEWISYYFPMNSSTHELVRDSQLLHRVKDKSSRWMRTNEIEALKGWKHTCSLWTQKTPFAPTHSMKPLPIPPLAKCSRSQEMLMNGRNGWIYNHSESSITR